MKYFRKDKSSKKPKIGSYRIIKQFLWLPERKMQINDMIEYRWLEYIYMEQKRCNSYFYPDFWMNTKEVDKKEYLYFKNKK
jgi:hypothetical protein